MYVCISFAQAIKFCFSIDSECVCFFCLITAARLKPIITEESEEGRSSAALSWHRPLLGSE